jgi:hypothetical protein
MFSIYLIFVGGVPQYIDRQLQNLGMTDKERILHDKFIKRTVGKKCTQGTVIGVKFYQNGKIIYIVETPEGKFIELCFPRFLKNN